MFIRFKNLDEHGKPLKGKAALPVAIRAGQRMSNEIKAIMPPPQSLEYEKTFYPFILFSKKRYVGNLYEDDPDKKPKQKSMGIVLKRRDNAPIVKTVFGGVIDAILNKHDLVGSVDFLKQQLQDLIDGKAPLESLIITKTLRAEYKDATKIAHKVLADRMGERDPGNKPAANDRIPFVYIQPPPGVEVKLQGDRIEHPDYIREQSLSPDYRFYITNQIMKPVCQLYALCVEQLPGYEEGPSYWEDMAKALMLQSIYANSEKRRRDRITALRMRMAEQLLFDPYLEQLPNHKAKKRVAIPKAPKVRSSLLAAEPGSAAATAATDAGEMDPATMYTLTLSCAEVKSSKCYEAKVAIHVPGADPASAEEVWSCPVKVPKRKGATKLLTMVKAAEYAIETGVQQAFGDDMRARGVCIHADATFVRAWIKAHEDHAAMQERVQKAIADQDIGLLRELQSSNSFTNLLHLTIPYLLHPIKAVRATRGKGQTDAPDADAADDA